MTSNVDNKRYTWRIVDITVASVIAVACSLIYWVAALAYAPLSFLDALVPGLLGFMNGLWLFAGPLALIIVRKPGAAIYAEIVAAVIEALLGNAWGGLGTILIGLAQGAAVEIVFAIALYKVWNVWITTISGALSGLACWAYTFFTNLQAIDWNGVYGGVNLLTTIISGILFAGFFVWWIYIGIAKTGALDHFESGRVVRQGKVATSSQAQNSTDQEIKA
ncbi:ECF transporter S component [Alloscardovia venturai]|uniref:ECF transporter S component n=1 Tax=Alloscardovia venturai TaxID=1769421 RepID=A0ABW2Y7M4_9BIFI